MCYRCVDRETGNTVAVKVLNRKKNRRITEHLIMAELDHPNLVKFRASLEIDQQTYIVLDYCAKGDLCDYVYEREYLKESEARRFMNHITEGVAYLHENWICHRDLKLDNIFLDGDYVAKIGDFGASCHFDQENKLTYRCGTTQYNAPELIKNHGYFGDEVDCVAADTLVTLATGLSYPIADLSPDATLPAWDDQTSSLRPVGAHTSEVLDKGERPCVTVVLEDGRELVSTANHLVLALRRSRETEATECSCSCGSEVGSGCLRCPPARPVGDARYVRADRLQAGDRVMVSLVEGVPDRDGDSDTPFVLPHTAMSLASHRSVVLAVARLAGRAAATAHVPTTPSSTLAADRAAVQSDLDTALAPAPGPVSVATLESIVGELPDSLLSSTVPYAVVRECAAAVLGALDVSIDVARSAIRFATAATDATLLSLLRATATALVTTFDLPVTVQPAPVHGGCVLVLPWSAVPLFMDRVGVRYSELAQTRLHLVRLFIRSVQAAADAVVDSGACGSSASPQAQARQPLPRLWRRLRSHMQKGAVTVGPSTPSSSLSTSSATYSQSAFHDFCESVGYRLDAAASGAVQRSIVLSVATAVTVANAGRPVHVYDVSVPYYTSFVANGIVVHNCWALGVVLYVMLVGKFPFDSETDMQLLWQVLKGLKFPRDLNLSDEARDLMMSLTEPNPTARATIDDVRESAFLQGLSF
jgi:serine/threonine protein kinase